MIVELTSIVNLDRIDVSGMSTPKSGKMKIYEDYFLTTGCFANPLIVDEFWNIRAGYVTYLLAKKYGVRPHIFEVRSAKPLVKLVKGRYVRYIAWEWKTVTKKQISRVYTLRESVVPGDILRVETRNGAAYMQVDEIRYTDIPADSMGLRKTLKYIKKRA